MTKITVSRRESFEAAHFLPNYPGPCSHMHGHRWDIEVGVDAYIDPKTGMACDFNRLKSLLRDRIVDVMDHECLNNILDVPPTAENLAIYVQNALSEEFGQDWSFVRIWENEKSYVELRR